MTKPRDPRSEALRRFAMSITAFTVLGHAWLGFEQAYATPVVAVLVAYVLELGLEAVDAKTTGRPARYGRSVREVVEFLLPAHITGLACAMLLYANSELWPVVFAVVAAIASKHIVRVRINGRLRHVLNPSNTGIAFTLVLFPWVGIAMPYEFTEWIGGPLDWVIPAAIFASGTMLNAKLTGKGPLIIGWVGGFTLQALIRTAIEGTATKSALLVMTGTAFVLFTNYMITDPGTTPVRPSRQVVFGAATAGVYGLLVHAHVVFGFFFALVIVCAARGFLIVAANRRRGQVTAEVPAPPAAAPVEAPVQVAAGDAAAALAERVAERMVAPDTAEAPAARSASVGAPSAREER